MSINFIGQFFGPVGIGAHCRGFADSLYPKVDKLNLIPIHPNVSGDRTGLTSNIENALKNQPDPAASTLAFWYPETFPQLFSMLPSASKKIGYYIFEYNKIPHQYIPILNQLDAVCTTSSWAADVLRNNGVTVPVHNVPGGVDTQVFNSSKKNLDGKKFRFLHIGKAEERKNTKKIIRAFARAFKDDRKVRMTLFINNIHIQGFDSSSYVYNALNEAGLGDCFSKFDIRGFVPDLTEIYNTHHAAIYPSSSEGLGLPIVEAMSCGLPVITTCNTAMMDYANDENTILLKDIKEEPVWDPHFFPIRGERGTWAVPSEDEMVEKMKWVYENYEKASEIGNKAELWVSKNYTWNHATEKLLKIL